MPALTKTQLEHAKAKIEKAAAARRAAFIERLGPEPEMPEYTSAVKREMIMSGAARLKPGVNVDNDIRYQPLSASFDFPKTGVMAEAEVKLKLWNDALAAENAKIEAISEALIDKLVMSPDGMSALAEIATAFNEA